MLVHEINAIYFDSKLKKTVILTHHFNYVDVKPKVYIELLCNRYGLSLDGSLSAIKRNLKIHQKCPVLVHPLLQIYLFPTCSMEEDDCIWINSKQIKKISRKGLLTEIMFSNGISLECNVGNRSIKKQILRCEMMENHILYHYQIDQLSLKV